MSTACYFADGTVADDFSSCGLNSTVTNYTSSCCAYGEGCAANGMCYASTRGVVYLGACENKNWTDCNMESVASQALSKKWTSFGWTNFYWCNYQWWSGNTTACTVCETSDDCSKGNNGLLFDGPSEDSGWNIKGYAGISSDSNISPVTITVSSSGTSTPTTASSTSNPIPTTSSSHSSSGTSDAVKIVAIVIPCAAVAIVSLLIYLFFKKGRQNGTGVQAYPYGNKLQELPADNSVSRDHSLMSERTGNGVVFREGFGTQARELPELAGDRKVGGETEELIR